MERRKSFFKILIALFAVVCALVVFASCSQSHKYGQEGILSDKPGFSDSGFANEVNADKTESDANSKVNEKLIKEVSISAETLAFDDALKDISDAVKAAGGYVSNSTVNQGSKSQYYGRGYVRARYAEYEIRIPAENLDGFLKGIEGQININSSSEKVTDATETYYDIQARLETLNSKKDALNEMLSKAENVNQLLDIQDKLYQTISEIESYKARLMVIDSKVSFSTVKLTLTEVEVYTPSEEESFGTRVKESFKEGWENFVEGWQNFTVWFVGALPGLLLFVLIALAVFLIIRGIIKGKRKKAAKRAEEISRANMERQQNAFRENTAVINPPIYGNVHPGMTQQNRAPANGQGGQADNK
jgi:large-conductance mechanosensitive channel